VKLGTPSYAKSITRAIGLVVAIDLGITAAVMMLWVLVLEVGDIRLSAPVLLARCAISAFVLYGLLAPVQRFVALRLDAREIDDATLLAADDALQQVFHRISAVMMIAWTVGIALTLLPAIGVIFDVPVPRAELMTVAMVTVAIILTVPIIFFNPLRMMLHPALVEVSTTILERGLSPSRQRQSSAKQLTTLYFSTLVVCLLAGCGVASLMRARGLRAETLAEQQRLVEVTIARGVPQPGAGVRIVGLDELPPILEIDEIDPSASAGTSFARFDPRREVASAAASFGDGRWACAEAEPDERLGAMLGFIVVFCVLGLSPSFLNSVAIGRATAQPIEELDATTRELVETGRLGRIARIVPLRNDEVGALALTFNAMLDAFDELAVAAQRVADGDLQVSIERDGDLPDAFRAMLARLQGMVGNLRETTLELGSAASELLVSTQAQAIAAQQQATTIAVVTTTTTSLAHSSARISTAADAARDNAEDSVTTAIETATKIVALDSQTRSIRELLEQIHEIADRSDLLALNGSLEAVRAGESGRAFALVAAEMRRLAERVGDTTAAIHERVASIEAAAATTVDATSRSRELATRTAAAAREISEIIAEQTNRTNEAAAIASEAATIVSTFADASNQTRATALSLRVHAEQLERLTNEFRT
jgi:methyl-accepting chemotaxis protein